MNDDLISRDVLKEVLKECAYSYDGVNIWIMKDEVLGIIDNAPTVRPQGEWVEGKNGNIKCNKCGCEIRYSYLVDNKPDYPKFCCDCGAKMKGGEEQ